MEILLNKLIEILKIITSSGRKMTVTIVANIILGILAGMEIVLLKQTPSLCYWMIAGTNGFFFGLNILGDHFLDKK